ncbi:MAG: winged helix-turn-helix transcriptional regulator [Solirubrobacteraceae bacterium]
MTAFGQRLARASATIARVPCVLQEGGVIRRVPLAHCGLVYELTEYGRELEPIVLALGRWGFRSMGEPKDDDIVSADSLTMLCEPRSDQNSLQCHWISRSRWAVSSCVPRSAMAS